MHDFGLRARLALAESLREQTRRSPGGEVLDQDGLLLFRNTDDFPIGYFNGAVRTDDRVGADEIVERASRYFGDRGFTLWVEGQDKTDLDVAADAAGLRLIGGDRHAMRFDLDEVAEGFGHVDRRDLRHGTVEFPPELTATTIGRMTALPSKGEVRFGDRVRVRTVASEAQAQDVVSVASAAFQVYGTSEKAITSAFGRLSSLRAPNVGAVVAYDDEQPVATAIVYVSYGVACVTWVASHPSRSVSSSATTVRENRNDTVAGLCTVGASVLGYSMGASWVAGPATRHGERLYRRLGASAFTSHRWYARTADA